MRAKYDYPSDYEIITSFKEERSLTKVARKYGIPRETFRDYLQAACRSALGEEIKPFLKAVPLTKEEKADRLKSAQRAWRKANPEAVKRIKRRWAGSRNPDVVRKYNVKNADRRKLQSSFLCLTPQEKQQNSEYERLISKDFCVYGCGNQADSLDHIRPINKGGTEEWTNYAPACRSCNSSKRDKSLLEFLLWKVENAQL